MNPYAIRVQMNNTPSHRVVGRNGLVHLSKKQIRISIGKANNVHKKTEIREAAPLCITARKFSAVQARTDQTKHVFYSSTIITTRGSK